MNLDGTDVNLPEGEAHALQALRSADPALDIAQLDLVALREKVDTSDIADVSSLNEHAARTTRFPRWSYAAAAAVVALGVGTGAGYSIAARGSDGKHASTAVLSAINAMCSFKDPNCNDTPGQASTDTLAGASVDLPKGYAASSIRSETSGDCCARAWLTPSDSLSDTPGTAHAYVMSTDKLDRSAAVKGLIEAFNMGPHSIKHSSPSDETRVTEDNSPAELSLSSNDNLLAGWFYDNIDNGPDACAKDLYNSIPKMHANDLKPGECEIKSGTVLSDADAIALAKDIFEKAGLDLDNVTWETNSGKTYFPRGENNPPYPYIQVVADMTVEGQDTGLQWTIEFAPDKSVIHASGVLAQPVRVPDYETVGARTAVLRSQDLTWADSYGPEPISEGNRVNGLSDLVVYVGTQSGPPLDAQGRPVLQARFDRVEITKAEPGLAGFYIDNALVMLPVYKLMGGGRTWTQLSVADKYLQVE